MADAGSLPQSESNRMLTAVDLTATGVIVNKQFLNVTHSSFKCFMNEIPSYDMLNVTDEIRFMKPLRLLGPSGVNHFYVR